ncbi:MAG: ribosome silencing factor [Planctomycetes bacterium]|nr:ribosome silencing factor [Planctomycetota bacterium]
MTEIQHKLTTAQIAHKAADLILDKKGQDLVVLDISAMTSSSLADYLVIATGANKRQVQAIAEELDKQMKHAGVRRLSVTGRDYGWWVLVDLGDVLVHVMQEDARRFYDLESLWADAPIVRRVDGMSPEVLARPDADSEPDPDEDPQPAPDA